LLYNKRRLYIKIEGKYLKNLIFNMLFLRYNGRKRIDRRKIIETDSDF